MFGMRQDSFGLRTSLGNEERGTQEAWSAPTKRVTHETAGILHGPSLRSPARTRGAGKVQEAAHREENCRGFLRGDGGSSKLARSESKR